MIKKIIRNGKEVDFIGYDRELETTFNTYTVEEIQQYKTLMHHVGGRNIVAYELFKKDNGYKDTSMRGVKDKDGNTVYVPIKELFFSKDGKPLLNAYKEIVNKALNLNYKKRMKIDTKTQDVVVVINKIGWHERKGKGENKFKGE